MMTAATYLPSFRELHGGVRHSCSVSENPCPPKPNRNYLFGKLGLPHGSEPNVPHRAQIVSSRRALALLHCCTDAVALLPGLILLPAT
jgi:hypothetical protein